MKILVNPTTEIVEDSVVSIGAVNAMVAIQFADVKFDEDLLPHDILLQTMKKKNDIDMMLFREKIPLESEIKVEDNLFTSKHVSKEIEETEIEA